jgi:hypothetical protein
MVRLFASMQRPGATAFAVIEPSAPAPVVIATRFAHAPVAVGPRIGGTPVVARSDTTRSPTRSRLTASGSQIPREGR